MSRPPLEVADIIRAAGDAFIERNRHWLGWKHVKVLLAIVRCRTAALGGHLDECMRCGHRAPSRTTAAETAIARNVRPLLGIAGSLRVGKNCFPRVTCTWSSRCPIAWCHWCCRTKRSSTISYSVAVPKPFSKLLATRDVWGRKLASSVSCTPGAKSSPRTLTHDAWHYHLLLFQRTRESAFPDGPLVEPACLSERAA